MASFTSHTDQAGKTCTCRVQLTDVTWLLGTALHTFQFTAQLEPPVCHVQSECFLWNNHTFWPRMSENISINKKHNDPCFSISLHSLLYTIFYLSSLDSRDCFMQSDKAHSCIPWKLYLSPAGPVTINTTGPQHRVSKYRRPHRDREASPFLFHLLNLYPSSGGLCSGLTAHYQNRHILVVGWPHLYFSF